MFAGRGKVEIFRSIIDSLRIARTSQNNNIIISTADTTTQIPLTGIIFLPHLHFIQKIIHITHAMSLVFWIYPLLYFLQEGRCYCSLFLLLLSLPVLITTEYIFIQNFSLFVSIEKIHLQAIVAVLEENESNKKMLLQVKHTIRSYMKSLTLVNTATSTYTETNSALISQTPTPTTTSTTPSHQEEEEEEEDKQEQVQQQEPEQQQLVQQQEQQQEQQQVQQQEQVIGKDTIEGDTTTKEISIFQERLSHFKHPELSLPTFNTLLLLLNISVSDVLSKEIFYAIQNLYIESLTLQSLQDFLFKENDHLKTQQSDYAQLLLQVIAARQTSACSTSTQHQTYYNHQISLEYILSELATVDTSVELLNDLDQSFSSISSSSIVSCKNLSRNSSSNSRSTSSGSGSGSRSSNLSPPIIIPKLPIGIDNLIVEGNQSFSEINEIPPRQKTNKHHSHSHSHSPRINGEHKKQHTPRSKQSPRGQPTLTSPYYDPVSDSDDSAIPKPRPKTPKSHNDPLATTTTTTQVTSSSNTATTTNTATTISFEEISSIDNNLVTTAATTNTIPNIAKKSPRSSKNTSNEMKSRRTRSSNSKKGDTSLPQSFSGKTADSADIYSDLAVKRRKSLQGDPNKQPRRSHTTDEIGKVYDPWTFSDDDQTQRFVMTEPNDT